MRYLLLLILIFNSFNLSLQGKWFIDACKVNFEIAYKASIYFKEDDPILDVNVFKDTLSDLRANNLKEFKYLNYSLEVSYIDSISLYLKVKYSLLFLERIKIYYFTYE